MWLSDWVNIVDDSLRPILFVFRMLVEVLALDFNSKRLEETMKTLSCQPDKSIRFCGGNCAEAKAIYRMLDSENLDQDKILRAHGEQTAETILLI